MDTSGPIREHAAIFGSCVRNMRTTRSAIAPLLILCVGAAEAQDNVFELGELEDITIVGEAADADTTDGTVTIEDV